MPEQFSLSMHSRMAEGTSAQDMELGRTVAVLLESFCKIPVYIHRGRDDGLGVSSANCMACDACECFLFRVMLLFTPILHRLTWLVLSNYLCQSVKKIKKKAT